jgi:hypothetical protein
MEISADYTDYADYVLCLRSRQEDLESAAVSQPKSLLSAAPTLPREDSAPWFQRTAVLPNDALSCRWQLTLSRNLRNLCNLRILNSALL